MIIKFFEAFDDHCLAYLFLVGFTLGIFSPVEGSAFFSGLILTTIGGLAWYSCKAVIITAGTIKNWDRDHPGEPMWSDRGLTDYDRNYAEAVGKAAAEAIRRQSHDGK